jgi:hypothetical protein
MLELGPYLRFAVLNFALGLVEHAAFIEPEIRLRRAAICQMTSSIFMLFRRANWRMCVIS